ncbi:MAG: hypothetical protein ACXVJ7_19150, partial [Acidimicrobiia bacterium]
VASNATTIVMAAKSASGTCYVIGDVATGPGTIFENIGQNTCTTSGMTLPDSTTTVSTGNATSGGGWAQSW